MSDSKYSLRTELTEWTGCAAPKKAKSNDASNSRPLAVGLMEMAFIVMGRAEEIGIWLHSG